MKTITYLMIALFMGMTFTACSTDSLAETEALYDIEKLSTEGEDGEVVNDPDEENLTG